jgi:hypothetical protein
MGRCNAAQVDCCSISSCSSLLCMYIGNALTGRVTHENLSAPSRLLPPPPPPPLPVARTRPSLPLPRNTPASTTGLAPPARPATAPSSSLSSESSSSSTSARLRNQPHTYSNRGSSAGRGGAAYHSAIDTQRNDERSASGESQRRIRIRTDETLLTAVSRRSVCAAYFRTSTSHLLCRHRLSAVLHPRWRRHHRRHCHLLQE